MGTIRNILRNARDPRVARELITKVRRRREPNRRAEATRWARERAVSIDGWCTTIDSNLWKEVSTSCEDLARDARSRLEQLGLEMGGGGAYPLLMFITRLLKPKVVLETGVAAGWSSRSILEALQRNGSGKLYSTDFPYFRHQDPEEHIGWVVPTELKVGWHLDIRGDRIALPGIVTSLDEIDMFHYDSDKSYRGRSFAMTCISKKLSPQAVVIMDDIQDNLYFHDFVRDNTSNPIVFEFEGKFIGAVGLPASK